MTREEILGLEGRELDAAVAKSVMGDSTHRTDGGVLVVFGTNVVVPHFSFDANAARLVLAEVERRGLHAAFIDALEDLIWPDPVDIPEAMGAWGFLTATPAQICRAALLSCMEVE